MKRLFQLFLLAAFAIGLSACTQIDTGNVGVKKVMGQVQATELPPGTYFTLFTEVDEILGGEAPMPLDDLKPQTSDKITLQDLDVDIYVQLNTDKAAEIMTRFKGDRERIEHESGDRVGFNFVKRKARETVYDVVSRHASSTIHTERTALAAEIQKDLQARLNAAAPSYFNITSANVRNLVTDPALEANIKAIAVANLNSQAKDREIDVARKEAERKRIEAQGDADAIRVKAEAVNAAGGSGYVQLKAVEKWNGVLPSTNATGSLPFVNVK